MTVIIGFSNDCCNDSVVLVTAPRCDSTIDSSVLLVNVFLLYI